ncbi:MAG TPA: NAD(P)/FAD-dependent oxidoreductase [Gemmatimonadaceae bacterium]|nr:NAD(P)/FAD-dependent oxidoreductase [Gemmatimonadaceae bacterium]
MNDSPSAVPDLDVAIVGGGPAGLTAALFLARYLHSVVVVDSCEPRNWEARGIHGYLGLHGITPPELRRRGRQECRAHGARFVDAEVRTVQRVSDDHFRLALDTGTTVACRRLLLAFGIKDIWPAVEGLDRCYGESVHHCPDCDGFEARGRRTVVIASGRKAVGMALALATWTRDLVICTNGAAPELSDDLRAKLAEVDVSVVSERIRRVLAEGAKVRGVELEDDAVVACERIFFAIGHYPADDLGVQLGCDRDDEGMIEIDEHYHTSVRNVFAAGDIVPGSHLAITAAADGAVAALAIHQSLLPESRRLPKRRWRVMRD